MNISRIAGIFIFLASAGAVAGEDSSGEGELIREIRALREEIQKLSARLEILEKKVDRLVESAGPDAAGPDKGPAPEEDPGGIPGVPGPDFRRLLRKMLGSSPHPGGKSIEEVEKELENLLPLISGPPPGKSRVNRGELRNIRLPEKPTPAEIRQYIHEIEKASRGQDIFSSTDPQINMLARVGREGLPMLVEAFVDIDNDHSLFKTCYLTKVICRLAAEEDRDLIIEALPDGPELAEVIVEKGWERSAKEALVRGLRRNPIYLPTDWIEAVARLKDPSTYEDLKAYLAGGSNPDSTYRSIKDLPGIDLDGAVAEAWDRTTRTRTIQIWPSNFVDWSRMRLAALAAAHGHQDALEHLVGVLGQGKAGTSFNREVRSTLTRLTPARGSDEEIKAWYRENREHLKFDRKTKMFITREE